MAITSGGESSIEWQNAKLLQSADKDALFVKDDKSGKLRAAGGFERAVIYIKNWFNGGKTLQAIDATVRNEIVKTLKTIDTPKQIAISKVPERYQEMVGNILLKRLAQQSVETAFTIACREGDLTKIKKLLQTANMQEKNAALQTACDTGNDALVTLLLQHNADVNAQDADGDTPLIKAARKQDMKICQILLREPAIDVNLKNKQGQSALDSTKDLKLQEAIKISKTPSNETLLMDACGRGDKDRVEKLLTLGASVNKSDEYEMTPLHYACRSGRADIIKLLITHGADINSTERDGKTPLMFACQSNDVASVETLLQCPNLQIEAYTRRDRRTALVFAAEVNNLEIVQKLLEKGAQVDTDSAVTPLISACISSNANLDVVKALVQKGADVNARFWDGSALFCAVKHSKNRDIVKFLIENKASIDAQDDNKRTALMEACIQGDKEMVQLLLDNKARVNISDEGGNTASYFATGRKDILSLIEKRKV